METYETGATTHEANNFILSADSTKEFVELLKPIQQEIWKAKEKNNLNDYNIHHYISFITQLVVLFNGNLSHVETLISNEIAEVSHLYYMDAINSIENDLF